MRTEHDFLGSRKIPADALYGIHSLRAQENFPDSSPFPAEWYKSMGIVKHACYLTYAKFLDALSKKYPDTVPPIRIIEKPIIEEMCKSALELSQGKYFDQFIVPGISGGAGTSINMNVNEIIANASLLRMGKSPGDYHIIHPIDHANIFQSTNDVVPTALRVCVMELLDSLEEAINSLRFKIEETEKKYRNSLRIAYTQMQEAVPSSFDKLFSSYNEALSRDWWRVSKCFERIKVVNLGGSAVGTGITVPRFFIFEAVHTLQELTKKPLTRSENLTDATNNLDSFVEIHATLKAHAVNLEKMCGDLRLLSCSLVEHNQISIPRRQVGSSIMPGKINPVIPEFVISASHKVYSNDMLISSLCAQGCLELNAYLPAIGFSIIESLKLLAASCQTIEHNLISGLQVHTDIAYERLCRSVSISTALVPYVGYEHASEAAKYMKNNNCSVFEANDALNLLPQQRLTEILRAENLLSLGYSIQDIME